MYEYQLYFPDPIVGDTVEHTITVRAWDGEGNSAFVSYRILYRFVDTGDVIGTAYIVIDATTVGLDVMAVSYTHLDVYKRQPLQLRAGEVVHPVAELARQVAGALLGQNGGEFVPTQ